MKKISLSVLIIVLLACINSKAQLNYLFSATSKPYVPVSGGIVPPLTTNLSSYELKDEGFASQIPIGFAFNYAGKSYEKVNIDVNGFIALNNTTTFSCNCPKPNNHLESGPDGFGGDKPVIAALWDDLVLLDTLDLVYKTTGHVPFRVFTVEWKKIKWTSESTEPALSMEVKLYETTNIIEFHYKDEGGLPATPKAFASIGITSSYNYRDFISLQNTSSHPTISLLRANNSLTAKPADNQVYRFIPSFVPAPKAFHGSVIYTNNKASFELHNGRFNSYEFAVTQSSIPPSSGIRTFSSNVTVSSLLPATTYYLYGRSNWFGVLHSQWVCDSFTTAVNPVQLPWHISGNANISPYLPPDVRLQDIYDTARSYLPNLDANWNVITDFPNPGDTSIWSFNTLYFHDADAWLFTPGLRLLAGKTYQLKFGYLSFATQVPGEISSFEIKYGEATGVAAMTAGTLFKRDDIVTDFNESGWVDFEDTTIEIRPLHTGNYYFGFHNLTMLNNGQPGPVPVIGNISIAEKEISSPAPLVLSGKTSNTDNILNWEIKDKTVTSFEVQKSTDGINFTKIGDVATNIMRPSKKHTIFRIYRNTEKTGMVNNKDLKAFDDNPRFELQRSDDGINFKKISPPNLKGDSNNRNINYSYTDRNADGINYYRLQQADKNGKLSYSTVVRLNNIAYIRIANIYPNPAKVVITVEMENTNASKMNLVVTDAYGKVVINKAVNLFNTKGINRIQLSISNLSAGAYNLKVICNNGCENAVRKFVKE